MKKNVFIFSLLFVSSLFLFAKQNQLLVPYKEEAVVLKTATGEIHGTLTLPSETGKTPIALIIAGSGPTDRNGNNMQMQNNSLQLLAEKLAENKIASLRFDKRGIGESRGAGFKEEDLRIEHYMDDVRAWIKWIKEQNRFSSLTVVGHSEGALIGMVAAGEADKFISIAGTGLPADEILKQQLGKQPPYILEMSNPIIDSLKKGIPVKEVNPLLNTLFRPSVQPYLISWFKYDPRKEIGKLKIPVLIVQGTKDIQVSTEDARLLHKANPKSKLLIIENMNHIFKNVTGNEQENLSTYNNKNLPVNDRLVKEICSFIPE
ncbi:MAG: lysophospholipase [Tannerella sp.]|jgi:alpha/beta superfamily hydrolase|nr:lysophospholipase [Tannerella sp.]